MRTSGVGGGSSGGAVVGGEGDLWGFPILHGPLITGLGSEGGGRAGGSGRGVLGGGGQEGMPAAAAAAAAAAVGADEEDDDEDDGFVIDFLQPRGGFKRDSGSGPLSGGGSPHFHSESSHGSAESVEILSCHMACFVKRFW